MAATSSTSPGERGDAYGDAQLARAYRLLIAREPLDELLQELIDDARARVNCRTAALVRVPGSYAAAARGGPSRADDGDGVTADPLVQPSLALPVFVDGLPTHLLQFYARSVQQRFTEDELGEALRLAKLAGLILAGSTLGTANGFERGDDTGVLARQGFEDGVGTALEENNGRAGLIIVRVCDLEMVNARRGRAVGDEVLRLVARTMRDAVGAEGTVGRLRRHEFGAVIPGADHAAASAVADALRASLESPLPVLGLRDVSTRVAIGAAATAGSTTSVVPILHAAYRSLESDDRALRREPRTSRFGWF